MIAAAVLAITVGDVFQSGVPAVATSDVVNGVTVQADAAPEGYKFGTVTTVSSPATAISFRFYATGGDAAQTFLPAVYSVGSDDRPSTLLVQGAPVTVAAGKTKGWVEAALTSTALPSGRYLLALISGPAGKGARLYHAPGGRSFWNEDSFSAPRGTWGQVNPDDVTWTFALGFETPTTTTTTPGGTNGGGSGGGCPAFPAFPNKTCTGVPAGTALSLHEEAVTRDNAVVSNVRIRSTVFVRANNVTFRNCLIDSDRPIAIAVERGFNGLTLENCTFKAGSLIAPFSGLTLRRVLVDPDPGRYRPDGLVVAYSGIGQHGQNVLIEDSYIGPQWGDGGSEPDHTDGIQFWGFGSVSNVTIRHNYIDSSNINPDPTAVRVGACAFLADATYRNVTFEYNYCTKSVGGGYFHLRLASDEPTGGHVIRGNRFANRGSTVPVDLFRSTPSVWNDNRFADNNELIPQPAIRG